jgi:glycosyltransferase involved in cell wall biosynthesis
MKAIWLTWERQRRNRSMAAATRSDLRELHYKGNPILRYSVLAWRTTRLVFREKPDVIFFQNPSIVLALLIATLKFLRLTRARTVGDFHNAGVFPPYGRFLLPFIVRSTDITIVSNSNLATEITALGGTCIAIPDPVPTLHYSANTSALGQCFEVLFICSWAPDEPITAVLDAAKALQNETQIRIAITGRAALQRSGWTEPLPANVELTGFLSDPEFEKRLANASLILDLTTREDCMVCGAYEAVSAGVPMILSNNAPTRAYFRLGALYTDNSANDIARLISEAVKIYPELAEGVRQLRKELIGKDTEALGKLTRLINES